MDQLSSILVRADYGPLFNLGKAVAGLVVCAIIIILLLHTLHLLGQPTILYRRARPVPGWNRRFFPAALGMIIILLAVIILLDYWGSRH